MLHQLANPIGPFATHHLVALVSAPTKVADNKTVGPTVGPVATPAAPSSGTATVGPVATPAAPSKGHKTVGHTVGAISTPGLINLAELIGATVGPVADNKTVGPTVGPTVGKIHHNHDWDLFHHK